MFSFSNIKYYAGLTLIALSGFLWLLLGKRTAQRDAEKVKADAYKDATIENAKEIESVKQAEKVRHDVNLATDSDVSVRLRKYARDRNQD